MLHNPFFIEVSRSSGNYRTLELIPVYTEFNGQFIVMRNYRIYNSYEPDGRQYLNGGGLNEQYFDSPELMREDNSCFLGEIQFNGVGYFEWRYLGDKLFDKEVWQIVDLLQNCVRTYIS